ncbi:uncharacterized protein E0L32_001400 [Thyridium curvatum]|uniref:Uncharacterized protein n=1 Tax=Thyridium curvatum TaxID=1093900 RepID=A0A507AQX9_9PEZI|nr:uncharacterized protein E0L32_001400 [Thyridium curvatum]TPX10203.1 hypothetical protein E0L32_001400 [Thyridium curvatum]
MESSCFPPGGTGTPVTGPVRPPQIQLLDFLFPGLSVLSEPLQRYFHIDLNIYIPLVLLMGGLTFAWRYLSETFRNELESHFMSTVDIRCDDEIYNMLMGWVASQKFARSARRFVVNTNINSRSWFLCRYDDDEEDEEGDGDEVTHEERKDKKKALSYTPTFGSHYFWYKGRLLIFRRTQNREQNGNLLASEREEISLSCFGRNPSVLKELLLEARTIYMKRDEKKTLIYRGASRVGSSEPTWQRCMARASRPFSTVILNEQVKKDLIDDVTDYLDPATRRWYSNRGIPYRRGYLLHGPPGTGKSSLSLALAGFFKMRIYIVSLNSINSNEESLASLFAELPRRCVVLLEDIDTAGLTHTREHFEPDDEDDDKPSGGQEPSKPDILGRLSLSGLLNILDGVASQEGRVLIMTTNHLEKLDKALIRPGRVDMIVKFDRADEGMIASIFRAIFAPHEADEPPSPEAKDFADAEAIKELAATETKKRDEITERVNKFAEDFAAKIPSHEFSPAEIQGFLLRHKRIPDAAIAGAEQWVVDTRKEKKEKELREAEDKRKEEEKKMKEKEEADKKSKDEEKKKNKKQARKEAKKKNKAKKEEASSDPSDTSSSDGESEAESGTSDKATVEEGKQKKSQGKAGEEEHEEKRADSGYGSPS